MKILLHGAENNRAREIFCKEVCRSHCSILTKQSSYYPNWRNTYWRFTGVFCIFPHSRGSCAYKSSNLNVVKWTKMHNQQLEENILHSLEFNINDSQLSWLKSPTHLVNLSIKFTFSGCERNPCFTILEVLTGNSTQWKRRKGLCPFP